MRSVSISVPNQLRMHAKMPENHMRTDWEKSHILSLKDIRCAKKYFKIGEIRYWHILGILGPHPPFGNAILHSLDRILTRVPFVKLMAWIFTFELKKS